jgi:hypothetical protein
VKEDEMARACNTHVLKWNSYRILVRESEGKIPLGRRSNRWEDVIRMDLREIECSGTD